METILMTFVMSEAIIEMRMRDYLSSWGVPRQAEHFAPDVMKRAASVSADWGAPSDSVHASFKMTARPAPNAAENIAAQIESG